MNASTAAIISKPLRMSRFLFLPYVHALAALASTSLASAMPTASYGSMPKNVISIGLMTAAALMPANPVPKPAPKPASRHTSTFSTMRKAFLLSILMHIVADSCVLSMNIADENAKFAHQVKIRR